MGVNRRHEVFYRKGVSSTNPTGTEWVKVRGRLVQVDVDGDSQVVGVSSRHHVYQSDISSGELLTANVH